ncbi:hypothetical protein [Nonomuraea sp. NPDC049607]|uniref:hypothetical protein n=1 Tax=Nonomuraea sp. NPDC049607 TaxID=3154732 RepID=UPI003446A75C
MLSAYVRGHDVCTLKPGQKKLPHACTFIVWNNKLEVSPLTKPGADVVAALTVASNLALADGLRSHHQQAENFTPPRPGWRADLVTTAAPSTGWTSTGSCSNASEPRSK